jgi:hypothetical protein
MTRAHELSEERTAVAARAPDAERAGSQGPPEALLALQRSIGNRAVRRLVSDPAIDSSGRVHPELEEAIEGERAAGQPLDTAARQRGEGALGVDLGGVRVHTGPRADTLSRALAATAFTTGSDIFFSRGAYDPSSAAGMELIGHELTHVVQQGGEAGAGPLAVGPADDEYEREAARAGRDLGATG